MKLYKAKSTVDDFEGHDGVRLHWFRSYRKQPVAPYEELIADYESLDEDFEDGKAFAEELVDGLFTQEEIEVLRTFLWTQRDRTELEVTEVSLPVVAEGVMPVSAMPVGGFNDFLILRGDEEHPLPFGVWGYYDLRGCPQSAKALRRAREELKELEVRHFEPLPVESGEDESIRKEDLDLLEEEDDSESAAPPGADRVVEGKSSG